MDPPGWLDKGSCRSVHKLVSVVIASESDWRRIERPPLIVACENGVGDVHDRIRQRRRSGIPRFSNGISEIKDIWKRSSRCDRLLTPSPAAIAALLLHPAKTSVTRSEPNKPAPRRMVISGNAAGTQFIGVCCCPS